MGAQVYETKAVRLAIGADGGVHVTSKLDAAALLISPGCQGSFSLVCCQLVRACDQYAGCRCAAHLARLLQP